MVEEKIIFYVLVLGIEYMILIKLVGIMYFFSYSDWFGSWYAIIVSQLERGNFGKVKMIIVLDGMIYRYEVQSF